MSAGSFTLNKGFVALGVSFCHVVSPSVQLVTPDLTPAGTSSRSPAAKLERREIQGEREREVMGKIGTSAQWTRTTCTHQAVMGTVFSWNISLCTSVFSS